MTLSTHPELLARKQDIIDGMTSYMKFGGALDADDPDFDADFDAGYVQANIDSCGEILDSFLEALTEAVEAHDLENDEDDGQALNDAIAEAVKTVVQALNVLNEQCEGGLIETDQREQLCDLIITAASEAGLDTEGQDITEEWREW
jgi:hypothetical protein